MAKNKPLPKTAEEILRDISPVNRPYVEKFFNSKNGSNVNYRNAVLLFAKHFGDGAIEHISPSKIEEYIDSLDAAASNKINHARFLTNFYKVVLPLDERYILVFKKIAKKYEPDAKNVEAISLQDIIEFRNRLIFDNNYKTLFVFEMLYVHGVKWKDLSSISIKNYSALTGELETKSSGTIKLGRRLQTLIDKHPDLLTPKDYTVLAGYLNAVSIKLKLNITETGIEKTREVFFPACQRCKQKYPNTSDYWVLVECKEDAYHEKWILCISCANKIGEKKE